MDDYFFGAFPTLEPESLYQSVTKIIDHCLEAKKWGQDENAWTAVARSVLRIVGIEEAPAVTTAALRNDLTGNIITPEEKLSIKANQQRSDPDTQPLIQLLNVLVTPPSPDELY